MPAAPADATALLALSGRSGGPGSPSRHEAGAGPAGDEPSGTEVNGDSLSGDCRPSGGCGCPRCGSVDTKFCYFNNYNVKQPRFFCKSCQRYWTHGGTLRNVQPGAGRRKRTEGAPHLEEAPAGLASTGRPVSREGADTGSGTEPEDSGHQRSTRRRSLRTRRTPGVDGPAIRTASAGDGATSCRGAASVGGGFAPVAQRQSRSQGGKGVSSAAVGGASQLQSNATSLWLIPPPFTGTHAAPASLPMEVYPRPDALPWAVAATMAALHQHSSGSAAPVPTIAHDALATPAQHPYLWSSIDPNTCAAAAAIWPYTRLAMQAQQPTAAHSLATLAASSVCLAKPQPCSTAAPPSYLSALGLDALPLGKGLFSAPQPSLVANPAAFARSVLVQHQAAGQAAAASPDAAAATAAA